METKFKINQQVWFMSDNEPNVGRVIKIIIDEDGDAEYIIQSHVTRHKIWESRLVETKDELKQKVFS